MLQQASSPATNTLWTTILLLKPCLGIRRSPSHPGILSLVISLLMITPSDLLNPESCFSLFFYKFLARATMLTASGLEMTFPQDGADGPYSPPQPDDINSQTSRFETSVYPDGNGYSPSQFHGANRPSSTTPEFEMPFRQDAYGEWFSVPQFSRRGVPLSSSAT